MSKFRFYETKVASLHHIFGYIIFNARGKLNNVLFLVFLIYFDGLTSIFKSILSRVGLRPKTVISMPRFAITLHSTLPWWSKGVKLCIFASVETMCLCWEKLFEITPHMNFFASTRIYDTLWAQWRHGSRFRLIPHAYLKYTWGFLNEQIYVFLSKHRG